jgi:hypothetical protein
VSLKKKRPGGMNDVMGPLEYPFTHGKGAYVCPNWVTELLTNNHME